MSRIEEAFKMRRSIERGEPQATALCKYKGMLVTMEVSNNKEGKCPECGATEFHEHGGWVECDCGFAINKKTYEEIING